MLQHRRAVQVLTTRLGGARRKVHLLIHAANNLLYQSHALHRTAFSPRRLYLCCGQHQAFLITMSDDPFNPQPNPFHYWIIGVIIAVAIIVLLIFLRVVRYRQRYVRVQRPVYPTPSQVESGYNPDCKNTIQPRHACSCNDVYDPVITDTPPAYTPGRPPTYPAYPPG